jgi:hypothetical protein
MGRWTMFSGWASLFMSCFRRKPSEFVSYDAQRGSENPRSYEMLSNASMKTPEPVAFATPGSIKSTSALSGDFQTMQHEAMSPMSPFSPDLTKEQEIARDYLNHHAHTPGQEHSSKDFGSIPTKNDYAARSDSRDYGFSENKRETPSFSNFSRPQSARSPHSSGGVGRSPSGNRSEWHAASTFAPGRSFLKGPEEKDSVGKDNQF